MAVDTAQTALPARDRNRARIVDAAANLLSQHPDASMDDIARSASVARRTLYGHFAQRDDLILAVATHAADGLAEMLNRPDDANASATSKLARLALNVWSYGHHTRVLTALARQVDPATVERGLLPINAALTVIVREGQQSGEFSDHLPVHTMVDVLESQAMRLHEASGDGTWNGDAINAAVAALITVGIDRHVAVDSVAAQKDPEFELTEPDD